MAAVAGAGALQRSRGHRGRGRHRGRRARPAPKCPCRSRTPAQCRCHRVAVGRCRWSPAPEDATRGPRRSAAGTRSATDPGAATRHGSRETIPTYLSKCSPSERRTRRTGRRTTTGTAPAWRRSTTAHRCWDRPPGSTAALATTRPHVGPRAARPFPAAHAAGCSLPVAAPTRWPCPRPQVPVPRIHSSRHSDVAAAAR